MIHWHMNCWRENADKMRMKIRLGNKAVSEKLELQRTRRDETGRVALGSLSYQVALYRFAYVKRTLTVPGYALERTIDEPQFRSASTSGAAQEGTIFYYVVFL